MNAALHDCQRFVVEALTDWGLDEEGQVKVQVQWRGFDETEATWEPLLQLLEDGHQRRLQKFVNSHDHPDLNFAPRGGDFTHVGEQA